MATDADADRIEYVRGVVERMQRTIDAMVPILQNPRDPRYNRARGLWPHYLKMFEEFERELRESDFEH